MFLLLQVAGSGPSKGAADSETAEGQARVESFVRALLGLNGPASLYPSVSHCYLCILFPQCITTEKWDQTGKSRMHRGNY